MTWGDMDGSGWQDRIVRKMVMLCIQRYHGSLGHSDRRIGDRVDAILLRQPRNCPWNRSPPHDLLEGTAANISAVSRGLIEILLAKVKSPKKHDLVDTLLALELALRL